MAESKHSGGASYRGFAGRYLLQQIDALAGQQGGCRAAEDIECIHRARVASRRLRSALGIFRKSFPPARIRRWRKAIRRVTRGLGPARDADVQIAFAEAYLKGLTEARYRPGVRRLLLRLRQRRRARQPKVDKTLDRLAKGKLMGQMRPAMAEAAKGGDAGEPWANPLLQYEARRKILRQLDALLTFESSLADPAEKRRHHRMRIAAKRLRYTLEISRPIFRDRIDFAIPRVKCLQTLLGDLHDTDVWIDHIAEFMDLERQRTIKHYGNTRAFSRLKSGLVHMLDDRKRHRAEAFAELGGLWRELTEEDFWGALIEAARRRRTAPGADAPPASSDAPPAPNDAPPASGGAETDPDANPGER